MEKQEWKRKETIGEYLGVKRAVCKFMQFMMDEEVLNVEYDDQSDELVFITNSNALPEDIQKLVDEFSENIDEEDLKAAKKNLAG